MAIKKIPCGGFSYDDSTIEFVDGVMKSKGKLETWNIIASSISAEDGGTIFVENSDKLIEKINDKTILLSQLSVLNQMDEDNFIISSAIALIKILGSYGSIKYIIRVDLGSGRRYDFVYKGSNIWELMAQ